MKALRGLSIRQRLLLASLLPAALIAALVSIYFVQDASKMLDRSVEERGLAIVGFLAPASEYGLIAGNRESLVALLQAALNQRQVHAAAVIDRDGRALAMSGAAIPPELARLRELPGPSMMTSADSGQREVLRFAAPVLRSSVELADPFEISPPAAAEVVPEPLGWVYAEIDLRPLRERKNRLLLLDMTLVLIGLMGAGGLAVGISGAVSRPLSALADAVAAMARGRRDARVSEQSAGEVGALERGFNEMAKALDQSHEDLSRKVDQATAQLRHLAEHDALTGLPNRRAFEAETEAAISAGRRRGDEHALCFIDLDRFKIVNDTCGHAAGDDLLCRIAALLRGKLREEDMVARVGGDEFALLLRNCSAEDARLIAESLRMAVAAFRFVRDERRFAVGVSIGLVHLGGPHSDLTRALAAADAACFAAKRGGRNRVIEAQLGADPSTRADTGDEPRTLSAALESSRLHLYAHPFVGSRGESCEWAEVLLRLDRGGVGSAERLLDRCERNGEGLALDAWVLHASCQRLAAPAADLAAPSCISINLSGSSVLAASDYLEQIRQALARSGLPANRLAFELAADLAAQYPGECESFATALRELGAQLILDRFSDQAPALLHALRPDFVKIRFDLLSAQYGADCATAMAVGIAAIASSLGVAVILGGLDHVTPEPGALVGRARLLQGDATAPVRTLDAWLHRPHATGLRSGEDREQTGAAPA